jgi:hypothetical protein
MTRQRFEHAPAFTALDFLDGDRADLTPRAKAYIFANAKPLEKSYRRMIAGHSPAEETARTAIYRLSEVLKEKP